MTWHVTINDVPFCQSDLTGDIQGVCQSSTLQKAIDKCAKPCLESLPDNIRVEVVSGKCCKNPWWEDNDENC